MKLKLMAPTILLSIPAFALPAKPFSQKDFASLANTSDVVVVGFHSPSCGSCKVQKPNLEALLKEESFSNVHGLMADFDESEKFRETLAKPVRGPSTLVVFKGGKEISRIQGVTNKEKLRALLLEKL